MKITIRPTAEFDYRRDPDTHILGCAKLGSELRRALRQAHQAVTVYGDVDGVISELVELGFDVTTISFGKVLVPDLKLN